jgi:hypothetical protein
MSWLRSALSRVVSTLRREDRITSSPVLGPPDQSFLSSLTDLSYPIGVDFALCTTARSQALLVGILPESLGASTPEVIGDGNDSQKPPPIKRGGLTLVHSKE